jgi:hypothetical protein
MKTKLDKKLVFLYFPLSAIGDEYVRKMEKDSKRKFIFEEYFNNKIADNPHLVDKSQSQ